jgi:hypothetical protein
MKRIVSNDYFLVIIFLLGMLAIFGCSKSTEPESNHSKCSVAEHQWYQDIITEAEGGSLLHKISTISRYEYEDDYFFEVTNPAFSCLHCYIYDCDGDLAEFANSPQVSYFIDNRTDRVVIWEGSAVP